MNTVAVSLGQPIGSTNIGVIPKNFLNNEIQSASEAFVAEKNLGEAVEKYEKKGEKIRRRNGKFMGGNKEAKEEEDGDSRSDSFADVQSRRDTLTDINLGMSLLASTIKVVSAVLTILGADDTTSRNDDYDESIVTLLSTGASIVKVAAGVLAEYTQINENDAELAQTKSADFGTTDELTEEEKKYRAEAEKIVSSMSPEKVKLQQQLVREAVEKEVKEKNLNEEDAKTLLVTTIKHNGLPLPDDLKEFASLDALFADSSIKKVGLAADNSEIDGLPTPGTLEHSVALGIFKVQQGLNQVLGGTQGDENYLTRLAGQVGLMANNKIDTGVDKIGLAEGEVENKGGILSTIISIPQYIGEAVAGLITSGQQPDRIGQLPPGVTYSQVNNGLNLPYTALGLLTTGAVGTVAYNYLVPNGDLATSASSLASGAVEALRRNDIVDGMVVAASDTLSRVAGGGRWQEPEYADYNNYYDQGGYGGGFYSDRDYAADYSNRRVPPPRPYGVYNNRLGDYDREGFQTSFAGEENLIEPEVDPRHDPPPQDLMYQDSEVGESTRIEVFQDADAVAEGEAKQESIEVLEDGPDVNFYQPERKEPETPYVVYSEEHNPWNYLDSGKSTDHLYHRRKRDAW